MSDSLRLHFRLPQPVLGPPFPRAVIWRAPTPADERPRGGASPCDRKGRSPAVARSPGHAAGGKA